MRRAILILSLFALPCAAWAEEAKPVLKKAEPAVSAPADATVKAEAPAVKADVEAKPAPDAAASAAPAEEAKPEAAAKPVLKVVEKVDEPKSTTDPVPDDPEEVILLVEQLINAAKGGNWQLFVGLLLTLLVWILRKFNVIAFVPEKAVPWVAAAFGMLGFMGVSLASGLDLTTALIQGFLTGAAAVGLWELLGKHILKKTGSLEEQEAAAKAKLQAIRKTMKAEKAEG